MKSKRIAVLAPLAVVALVFAYCGRADAAPSIVIGTVSGPASSSVILSVNFASGTTDVSALQFDLMFPAGIAYDSIATGTVAAAAGKDVMAAAISGGMRVLIAGLNQTAIGTGQLANITLDLANSLSAGTYPMAPVNIVFSDPDGDEVASSSQSGSVTVSNSTSVIDSVPPAVAITFPTAGATVSGTVQITGTASDNVSVSVVQVSIDGGPYGSANSTSSWTYSWNTQPAANGSHTIAAKATDSSGNTTITPNVAVNIQNVSAAQKYPRLFVLTSLEGLAAIPANLPITATVEAGSTTLETEQGILPNAQKQYSVSFQSGDPQFVNVQIRADNYLSTTFQNIDTTVNSASAISIPQLSAGDLNNDNAVNSLDYSLMNGNWLRPGTGDLNGDGIVNSIDFAILKNNFGKSGQ